MNPFNSNTPIFLSRNLYELNDLESPIFFDSFSQDIHNSKNYSIEKTVFNNDITIDILTDNDKEEEIEIMNEIASNPISSFYSVAYENTFNNSNTQELVDKNLPLRKQKIFKIENSNDSEIFKFGIYDNFSNKMINEALNETSKNFRKEKKSKLKIFKQFPKKVKKRQKIFFTESKILIILEKK